VGKLSWGFLKHHRMFRAVIADTPNGFMVELFAVNDRWAVAVASTVDGAMRSAVERAEQKLEAAHLEAKKEARKRLKQRGNAPGK
jgi:hypothetical protein